MVLLFRLGVFLLLRVPELAVVEEAADWRRSIGRDLHEVESCLLRHAESFVGRNDTDLLTLRSDQADLGNADLTVGAVRIFGPGRHEARPTGFVHRSPCSVLAETHGLAREIT
jgi:hypothetical protein